MPPAKEVPPRDETPGPGKEVTPPPAASIRKGTALGRYVIGDVLGHGAMATVFRARDGQLGRTVAIKVMNMAIAARSDAGERFRREAQAVAALKHPSIVEIHDFATATDHEPAYIVAELIEGPTLRAFVESRRGRLLPEMAVLIAAQVADALAVAHEHGIVHRDVKPDNVMLEKRGSAARVVLTDFGVAHITGLETMTASGALVGSPAYMSPEQARGQDVGPAADVWGVGVLLYQMVTGALPFPGKEPFAVIAAVARGTFKRAGQVAATVSPELDQVIARCLRPAPGERYASARALADDLRALGKEVGLGDERATLRQFLDDADAFERALRPRVADAAVERARQHVRRGELARALAQVGRATAYVPDHRGADAVLRSVSARRRWIKGAAIAATMILLGGAGYGGWRFATKPRPAAPAIVAANAAAATPPKTVPAPPIAAAASAASASAAPAIGAPAETTPPRSHKSNHGRPQRHDQPPAPTVVVAPAPVVPPVETPPPAPPPPVVTPAPPPQLVTVTLHASMGLCYPSLDDEPTAAMEPEYKVKPGAHQVFCAANVGGPRLHAGEIFLRPGVPAFTKTIKWNDGKPSF
jgi:serine/threonine-protein kinase